MIKTFLSAVSLLLSVCSFAQYRSSDKVPPQWLKKPPVASNDSFTYETAYAVGASLDIARQKCLTEILDRSGMTNGVVVVNENNTKETLSQTWNNGKLSERVEINSLSEINTKSSEFKLFIKEISEYWIVNKDGDYCLTKLYAVSKVNVNPVFDEIILTTNYGAMGLWRSAILPGWGQLYKGSYVKGGLLLGGTASFVGGIVFCENMRKDCLVKMQQTHDINLIQLYSANSSNYLTVRNLCIGGVAALYIYALIDAITAPGASRIITRSNFDNYSLMPTLTPDGTIGLAASIKF